VTDRRSAEQRLDAIAPGYLAHVRGAAARLAHRDGAFVDVETALAEVRDLVSFDLDVPTGSRRRVVRLVKTAVKRLGGWYLLYLAQQISAFGDAVARFGQVLVERTDQVEERALGVARDVERLRQRVERLEAAAGPGTADPAGTVEPATVEPRRPHDAAGPGSGR
jgi:hypothetical protein